MRISRRIYEQKSSRQSHAEHKELYSKFFSKLCVTYIVSQWPEITSLYISSKWFHQIWQNDPHLFMLVDLLKRMLRPHVGSFSGYPAYKKENVSRDLTAGSGLRKKRDTVYLVLIIVKKNRIFHHHRETFLFFFFLFCLRFVFRCSFSKLILSFVQSQFTVIIPLFLVLTTLLFLLHFQ